MTVDLFSTPNITISSQLGIDDLFGAIIVDSVVYFSIVCMFWWGMGNTTKYFLSFKPNKTNSNRLVFSFAGQLNLVFIILFRINLFIKYSGHYNNTFLYCILFIHTID